MAERLKKCKTKIIHHAQTSFVPKRHLKENVHFIRDVIKYVQNKEEKTAFMFLDASNYRI